jgi:metallo-beta-lactamase family protein
MLYPHIIHHGAGEGVTGSCHQLVMGLSQSLLIDCGSFQGEDARRRALQAIDPDALGFPVDTVKLLIVTHVHADHVGRIAQLLAEGFKGPILCSEPSAALLPLVLQDAFRLQFGADERRIKRYLDLVEERLIALPFDRWFSVVGVAEVACRVRLKRAGHILGSAYVECDVDYPLEQRNKRIVFSGDLGASNTPFLPNPKSPERADLLVLETTYGDRIHEDRSTRQLRLEQVIDRALADHGTVLIPAFSLGRVQELLYELEDILYRKALSVAVPSGSATDRSLPINWPQLPVILDSPLASRLTGVYQAFDDLWSDPARTRLSEGRKPLAFDQLITIDTHARHLQTVSYLARTGRPAIVIAGQGMCAGGRIVDYLKAMLGDSRHNVIFVGYQAKGTPGSTIQKHGQRGGYVELDGQRFDIRARVETMGGYSAHADQIGLLEFVTGMDAWPAEIKLVHGEPGAKKALGDLLFETYGSQQKRLVLT